MSLFNYAYGSIIPLPASILTTTSTTTILSVTNPGEEVVVLCIRAALPSGASSTTVAFDIYDGSTAYQQVAFITLNADEVYKDTDPIYLPAGWSLRATRTAGGNVHITGVCVKKSQRGG